MSSATPERLHGHGTAAHSGTHPWPISTCPPEELLADLDDLILDELRDGMEMAGAIGATCLYAVYDPVTCQCTLASAGHPPPAVVTPDGTVSFLDIEPGPPLGVGGALAPPWCTGRSPAPLAGARIGSPSSRHSTRAGTRPWTLD